MTEQRWPSPPRAPVGVRRGAWIDQFIATALRAPADEVLVQAWWARTGHAHHSAAVGWLGEYRFGARIEARAAGRTLTAQHEWYVTEPLLSERSAADRDTREQLQSRTMLTAALRAELLQLLMPGMPCLLLGPSGQPVGSAGVRAEAAILSLPPFPLSDPDPEPARPRPIARVVRFLPWPRRQNRDTGGRGPFDAQR